MLARRALDLYEVGVGGKALKRPEGGQRDHGWRKTSSQRGRLRAGVGKT